MHIGCYDHVLILLAENQSKTHDQGSSKNEQPIIKIRMQWRLESAELAAVEDSGTQEENREKSASEDPSRSAVCAI